VGELIVNLEVVPRKAIEYKGAVFEEMDVDAILARKPRVALIDELAHTNIEGSKHRKRMNMWFELLDAWIDVLSTHEHSASGERNPDGAGSDRDCGAETVPDWVLQRVNEVVMIDLTPEALQNRMRRGDVYPAGTRGTGAEQFFPGDEPDRFAGTGVAPGGATGGPEPGTASASGGEGSGASCHPRTHCRMHQLESGRPQYLVRRAARAWRRP